MGGMERVVFGRVVAERIRQGRGPFWIGGRLVHSAIHICERTLFGHSLQLHASDRGRRRRERGGVGTLHWRSNRRRILRFERAPRRDRDGWMRGGGLRRRRKSSLRKREH